MTASMQQRQRLLKTLVFSARCQIFTCTVTLLLLAAPVGAVAQSAHSSSGAPLTEQVALQVQGSVYLLAGFGGNVVVQTGSQGTLVVDSGSALAAELLLSAIRKIAPDSPIRFVLNTGADPSNIGGNEILRRAGSAIFGGNISVDDPRGPAGAIVLAHENVGLRLAAARRSDGAKDDALQPTETFSGDSYDLYFNDEAVRLMHVPAAHTDANVIVFFRRSDVVATGDIFSTISYPVIDVQHGGTIDGEIAALNLILGLAVPRDKEEGGTIIVPGHGRLCDKADLVEYRDMVTIIRDRVRNMMRKRLSLQRILSQRPTYDYDGRFGANAGPWTTEDFVRAIYQTLQPSIQRN